MKPKKYTIYGIIQKKENPEYKTNEIVEVSLWKRNLKMKCKKGQRVIILTILEQIYEN